MGTSRTLRILAVLLVTALAGCGSDPAATPRERERPASFAEREITWAQGGTLHYGDQTFTLDGRVSELWRTSYGFIVALDQGKGDDAGTAYSFYDGRRLAPLKGDPESIRVSPDGRYAGWIDHDGPRRPLGRLAEAVVVDLRTGREVLRSQKDMGSFDDDLADLYEDAEVYFMGFDDEYAYWDTPTGDAEILRARIGTWDVEPGARTSAQQVTLPIGLLYDDLVGHRSGMEDDGRVSSSGDGILGFASPDGRWCLTDGNPGRLPVVDCRTGAKATPDYPDRKVFFGGWLPDQDTFYVLARQHLSVAQDETGRPDRSTGVIATCALPAGTCRTIERVEQTSTVVFALGSDSW